MRAAGTINVGEQQPVGILGLPARAGAEFCMAECRCGDAQFFGDKQREARLRFVKVGPQDAGRAERGEEQLKTFRPVQQHGPAYLVILPKAGGNGRAQAFPFAEGHVLEFLPGGTEQAVVAYGRGRGDDVDGKRTPFMAAA